MRESGFYWIKLQGMWMPADYDSSINEWYLIGHALSINEIIFQEIGDKIERNG